MDRRADGETAWAWGTSSLECPERWSLGMMVGTAGRPGDSLVDKGLGPVYNLSARLGKLSRD